MKYRFLAYLLLIPCWVLANPLTNYSEVIESKQHAEAHIIFSFVKSLNHGLSLSFEEEFRSAPTHRSHTTLSLSYAPLEYLSFNAAYVLKLYGNQGWSDPNKFLRHRVNLDAIGQYSVGQWKFSLRERLMLDARADDIDLLEKNRVDFFLRSRLQAQYAIPSTPLSLVGKMELFNTLNAKFFGQYINELRPEIGLQWKIDKKNSLNLAYRYNYKYERSFDVANDQVEILTHSYTHKHIILLTYKLGW